MSEIPEDIDRIATDLVRTRYEDDAEWNMYLAIAQALLTERNRALKEAGWQPIETAPRDGTYFIGFWPHMSGSFADHQGQYRTRWTGWGGGCWEGDALGRPVEYPTHWMPLPPPPAIEELAAALEPRP